MPAGGDARRQAGGTEQPTERRLCRKFRVVSDRPQLAASRLTRAAALLASDPRTHRYRAPARRARYAGAESRSTQPGNF